METIQGQHKAHTLGLGARMCDLIGDGTWVEVGTSIHGVRELRGTGVDGGRGGLDVGSSSLALATDDHQDNDDNQHKSTEGAPDGSTNRAAA